MKRLRRLTGNSEEVRIINDIIAELESLKFSAGPGIRFTGGSRGNVISVEAGKAGRSPLETWFAGDWDPNGNYVAGQGCCIKGGITAGLYMCHTDAPAGTAPPSPADYSHWNLVVSGNGMGLWM